MVFQYVEQLAYSLEYLQEETEARLELFAIKQETSDFAKPAWPQDPA